jgi:hypothetical protein
MPMPWCEKERHPTRAAALRAAARREPRRVSRDLRLRAYRCPAGRGWHLGPRRPQSAVIGGRPACGAPPTAARRPVRRSRRG